MNRDRKGLRTWLWDPLASFNKGREGEGREVKRNRGQGERSAAAERWVNGFHGLEIVADLING